MLREGRKLQVEALRICCLIAFIAVCVDAQRQCLTPSGDNGVCVPILTCEPITELLNSVSRPLPQWLVRLVQRSHCGTFNDQHHVCCQGTVSTKASTTTTTSTTPKPDVVSQSSSLIHPSVPSSEDDVAAGLTILQGLKCGKSSADRVANGVNANLSEYPWMALLVYDDGVTRSLDCGGSLINNRYVLTAAHCLKTTGTKTLRAVRLGEHNTNEESDCVGSGTWRRCAPPIQEIDIEEAIYSHEYDARKIQNDIGLIRLASRATMNSAVQPICLPISPEAKAGSLDRMIIAGWGRIENGQKANILQKAVVPVQDNSVCQKITRLIRITEKQLCAGGENDVDTCKGDSGGPIFFPKRVGNSVRFIQYGIVSAGSILCGSNYPGIYVRTASYLPWIAGNIKP